MSDKEVTATIEAWAKEARDRGEDEICIPMLGFLALMREQHEDRADWFDLEVVAMQSAERRLGYAYGVTVLLGRKVDEPGTWNY